MECPSYVTKNGLQIGGVDPLKASEKVKEEPISEVKTEETEEAIETIAKEEKKPKRVSRTAKKPTKRKSK